MIFCLNTQFDSTRKHGPLWAKVRNSYLDILTSDHATIALATRTLCRFITWKVQCWVDKCWVVTDRLYSIHDIGLITDNYYESLSKS